MYRVSFDDLPWEAPAAGIRLKRRVLDGKQLRLVEFARGLSHPEWCELGHIGYVLEGELDLEFPARTETFRAGDALYVPTGDDHKHRPVPRTQTVLLFLFEEVG